MGDFMFTGINSTDDISRLIEWFQQHLDVGNDEYLFAPGSISVDFQKQFTVPPDPTDDDLDDIVGFWDDEYECYDPHHRLDCSCRWDAVHTDPRQLTLFTVAPQSGRLPLRPCAEREQHEDPTLCWLCLVDRTPMHIHPVEQLARELARQS